ncbi:Armadillo-type fold containing protein [Cryptosporidium felis]|nr:Armadillo-type fold containing protein [Cryptosporidium felis]
MERILVDYQSGVLSKREAITEIERVLITEKSLEVLINTLALILKTCNLRDQIIREVFGLLIEFGYVFEKRGFVNLSGFSRVILEELLLEGAHAKDLEIRVNSLVGLNIVLRVIKIEDSGELGIDGDLISELMYQIALKDKSMVARGIAISNLGMVSLGKKHLLEIMGESQNYLERARSLSSIQLRFLDQEEIETLFTRMLDENGRVRRSFYKCLNANLEEFGKVVTSSVSWSYFIIICQFGLNDRDPHVRSSCLDFVREFTSNIFGNGSFSGGGLVSLFDAMINSISPERISDVTAANIETLAEIIIGNLKVPNPQIFLQDIFGDQKCERDSETSYLLLDLKTSQLLLLRVFIENYKGELELERFKCFDMENLILAISEFSRNSFIIRQILLIVGCIDKSDPEVRKTVRSLTLNCLKYTPFDDSVELLESELIPLESMVRSSEGGEWVAYFLHRRRETSGRDKSDYRGDSKPRGGERRRI